MKDMYDDSFIVDYNEGDRSLERLTLEHHISVDDILHVIKQGDTLVTIASQYYGTGRAWYVLGDINLMTNPFDLTVGDTLIIPSKAYLQ